MRKLIVQEFVSADGFAADKDGTTQFFEKIPKEKWKEIDDDMLQFFDTIDTILLGANTYKIFAGYWPNMTTEKEVVADPLNKIPKIVFSKTVKEAPWGTWTPAQVIPTSATEKIKQLRQENGKDMIVFGSLSLVKSLFNDNVIDELQLRVCPSLLGNGVKFVPGGLSIVNMELTHSKTYASGIVALTYNIQ